MFKFSHIKTEYVLIFFILLIGFWYRLLLTSDGNFIFNIDNARDWVDVREMVVLGKLRLIGPTSAIEGVYTGPAWYYLLALPFFLSSGHPYSAIILQIILWAIGGYFLLKLVSRYGTVPLIFSASLWIASNYIVLATFYSFNPNPITLLTPLFIFSLEKYLTTEKASYAVGSILLAGLFFNFEMNFGIFMPVIIILAIIFFGKKRLLKSKNFLLASLVFVITLLPQVLFDLKHQFIMTHSLIRFLTQAASGKPFNPLTRLLSIAKSFYDVLTPTYFNSKVITQSLIFLSLPTAVISLKKGLHKKDPLLLISLLYIFIPFLGYLLLPVTVYSWHLGGVMAASIILGSFVINKLLQVGWPGKSVALIIFILILVYSFLGVTDHLKQKGKPNLDPSLYKNELSAVDFVYQKAQGKNFRVYVYLPSVIDYPYQYLFWWVGTHRYGYIPTDYSYLPNKPAYITHKDQFSNHNGPPSSHLVFLIKEPDRIGQRHLWENNFKNLKLVSKESVAGLEIETRLDTLQFTDVLQ